MAPNLRRHFCHTSFIQASKSHFFDDSTPNWYFNMLYNFPKTNTFLIHQNTVPIQLRSWYKIKAYSAQLPQDKILLSYRVFLFLSWSLDSSTCWTTTVTKKATKVERAWMKQKRPANSSLLWSERIGQSTLNRHRHLVESSKKWGSDAWINMVCNKCGLKLGVIRKSVEASNIQSKVDYVWCHTWDAIHQSGDPRSFFQCEWWFIRLMKFFPYIPVPRCIFWNVYVVKSSVKARRWRRDIS